MNKQFNVRNKLGWHLPHNYYYSPPPATYTLSISNFDKATNILFSFFLGFPKWVSPPTSLNRTRCDVSRKAYRTCEECLFVSRVHSLRVDVIWRTPAPSPRKGGRPLFFFSPTATRHRRPANAKRAGWIPCRVRQILWVFACVRNPHFFGVSKKLTLPSHPYMYIQKKPIHRLV